MLFGNRPAESQFQHSKGGVSKHKSSIPELRPRPSPARPALTRAVTLSTVDINWSFVHPYQPIPREERGNTR